MKTESRRARLVVAVVSALVAILARMAMEPLVGSSASWLCLAGGVVFGAWYGGLKPGLITTAILLVAVIQSGDIAAACFFTLVSVAICVAMQRLRMESFRAQHAQSRLHEVLESTRDAVLSIDNEFRCLYVNAQAARIARKAPGQMFGRSLRTVFPETPSVSIYRELGRALLEQRAVAFEDKVEQTGRWYEFSAYPVAHGLHLFVRDITERKVAETERNRVSKALENEHFRLEAVLQEMPVGVIITGMEGVVELVNQAVADLFGVAIRPGDSLDAKRTGTMRNVHGDALEKGDLPLHRTLNRGEAISDLELEYVRPDGEVLTLVVNSLPLVEPAGRRRGALLTYTDVTSLRRMQRTLRDSELRLRRLFDSPVIGLISGEGERILEANDAFLRMIGYSREELADGGFDWRSVTPPEYLGLGVIAREQLAERGFTEPFEKEYFAKDGRRVPVQVGVISLKEGQSSPWLSYVLDISERRKLESGLREAAKLESIGLLAGGIAHDFNNILTGVMGNASLALETIPKGHPAREPIEYAVRATERAADLTRQLLAYAGKGRFSTRPLDVSKLTREIDQLIRTSIPRQVDLELVLIGDPPPVLGDGMQIQQLVMNMVINGAEAVGEETGKVVVTTGLHRLDAPSSAGGLPAGEYVSVTVEDTGCGMDEATLKRVFDPFFTTKFTGRGLGLAAALGIVRSHHGAIEVESTPGRGTRFRVLLPVSDSAPELPSEPAAPGGFAEPPEARGTILVVDDEAMVRDVARAALERFGYTVVAAVDGREALTIYRGLSHSISMVILDLSMPSMSGEETLRNLGSIHAGARVLLSSGFNEEESRKRFDGTSIAGIAIAGFIQKPYSAAALVSKVRKCLAAPRG